MPDYSQLTTAKVAELLKEIGPCLASFNQGTYRTQLALGSKKEIVQQVDGKTLGEGYCAGVCYEWVRRVLLGRPGKDLDIGYITFYYEALRDKKGIGDKSLQEIQQIAYQAVARMGKAWVEANSIKWWGELSGGLAPLSRTVQEGSFKRAAETMDLTHKRKRPYSDLLLSGSAKKEGIPFKDCYKIINAGLGPGYVTKFGFNDNGKEGHAVAAWQRKKDKKDKGAVYFFDPNIGVFEYNLNGLADALEILFRTDKDNVAFYKTCSSANAQGISMMRYGPPRLLEPDLHLRELVKTVPVTKTPVTTISKSPITPPNPKALPSKDISSGTGKQTDTDIKRNPNVKLSREKYYRG